MPARIRTTVDRRVLNRILRGPDGPVVRKTVADAVLVVAEARRRAPADTGRLRASINYNLRRTAAGLKVDIGTRVAYGRWVHAGTGIYGPRRRRITPVRARALVFRPKGGPLVFARSVAGMRPRRYLVEALKAVATNPVRVHE